MTKEHHSSAKFAELASQELQRRAEEDRQNQTERAAVDFGRGMVDKIFPGQDRPELAEAYARIERCRAADTDPETGITSAQGLTLSAIQANPDAAAYANMPARSGGFSLDFTHRCDEQGEPLHTQNKDGKWKPKS